MPLHEYLCSQCKHPFEELTFSSTETVHCPQCGESHVEKQLSTFGVGSSHSNPCGEGACQMPEGPAACGMGGCSPCCMN